MARNARLRLQRRFAVLLAAVAALYAVALVLLAASTVHAGWAWWADALAGVLLVLFGLRLLRRPDQAAGAIFVTVGLVALAGKAAITADYALYSIGRDLPLTDAALAQLDALLGFHWPAMLGWFNANPAAAGALWLAYQSFIPQHTIVPVLLICLHRTERAQTLLLAAVIGLFVAHAVGVFLPAVGAYAFNAVAPEHHAGIALVYAGLSGEEIAAVRSGLPVVMESRDLAGLIAFPSYHTMMAAALAWALWPIPYVRWAGLVLNLGMMAATPLHGSHYLCETLVGIPLGLLCVAAATRLYAGLDAVRAVRRMPLILRRDFRLR